MDGIFLPTVQHSGTWFLIELFKTNPSLHNVSLGHVIYGLEHLDINKPNVIQTHIDGNVAAMDKLVEERGVHGDHLGRNFYKQWNDHLMDMLVFQLPTVIPVRDPMLSVISRHRRHPELGPHTYLVDSWLKVIREWSTAKIFYVPVDQDLSKVERFNLLLRMCQHCKLDPWHALAGYAEQWPVQNRSKGDATARDAYDAGNAIAMRATFPLEWQALRDNVDELKPFFQERGYEEMPWW